MSELSWTSDVDVADVVTLAGACLAADGGMPLLGEEPFLRARFGRGTRTVGVAPDGRVLALATLQDAGDQVVSTGMVHPDARGRGTGRRLVAWAVHQAGDRALVVLTECCTPAAERLYARFGLREVFAERVMRHDLRAVPDVVLPSGIAVRPARDVDPADLFAAYTRSFADRPGFPNPAQAEWLGGLLEDDGWDRELSRVGFVGAEPVGFVNVVGGWIDQVGVVPAHRGRGLGAFLVAQALHGLQARGTGAAWLTVEVANPAAAVYERLGFTDRGKRARFSQGG